jgi:O-antigen/teichoic acid export membrane protein/GT2 family glycosyltransferase
VRGPQTLPVTVVICAYTDLRWERTRAAVRSVLAQDPAPRQVLLVVDHNPDLADRARGAFGAVTVLESEGPAGLSGARNTGLRSATQPITAFLDDDAEARPGWLAGLVEPFGSPAVVATGGSVLPRWPAGQPPWLPATFYWVVGCSYAGLPTAVGTTRNPIGANMSLRTGPALAAGGFSPAVGRVGADPRGCEETELAIRLTARRPGATVIYVPDAAVDHHVGRDRLTLRYLVRRCWHEGLSKAAVVRLAGAAAGLQRERSHVATVIPAALLRDLRRCLTGEVAGILRIAVSLAGLTAAVCGYVIGRIAHPLYRSSYALVMNTVGTTVVGVVYWAVAAHLYSRPDVGRNSALISALVLLSGFAQLNLVNTLPRFAPRAGSSVGKLIAYSYAASTIAALMGSLAFVTVLPRLSPEWYFLRGSPPLALAFVIGSVGWGVFVLQDSALLSVRRPAIVPAENFVYGMVKLLLLFLVFQLLPSTGIFVSWIIPLAITVPGVNWLLFRRYVKGYAAAGAAAVSGREVIRYASVDYLGSVLSQAYTSLLPLLVLSVLGATANASFFVAWTIVTGLGLVSANFSAALLAEGSAAPDRLAELTRGMLARCVIITASGAALIFSAARLVLGVYGSAYASQGTSLLRLLALGAVPYSIVIVSFALDRIAGRVGRAALIRLTLTCLILGGSWILARRYGVDGIALAWGGANTLVALARSRMLMSAAFARPRRNV